MKKEILFYIAIVLLAFGRVNGQDSTKVKKNNMSQQKNIHKNMNFVDKNGDGYNDNAPDHDGDGIPNGLDPDYLKLKKRTVRESVGYIDSDGDGINDNLQFSGRRRKMMKNKGMTGFNSFDGFGNSGMGSGNSHGQKGKKGRK